MSARQLLSACIALLAALLSACTKGPLVPEQFIRWAADPENGLHAEQHMGDFTAQLHYQPVELLAARESGLDDPSALQRAVVERKGAHYLNLRLQNRTTPNLLLSKTPNGYSYDKLQYYFTALIQDDLFLVIGRDTLPCAQAHFERNYGTAPFNNITASFIDHAADPYRDDIQFVFDDRAFGLGPVRFTITKDALRDIPALKTS